MSKLKFTVFSDLHHHPAWYKSDAPERLKAIQERALKSGSELLLHIGDFSHKPSACPELIKQYKEFQIPGYFVLGNHEFDIDSYETVLETMGLENGYYFFEDRHSESKDSADDSEMFYRNSYNFSIAVYDTDNHIFYYFELDT